MRQEMGGRWVIEVDETNRRMTSHRRYEGKAKLTAGWLVLVVVVVVIIVVEVVVVVAAEVGGVGK